MGDPAATVPITAFSLRARYSSGRVIGLRSCYSRAGKIDTIRVMPARYFIGAVLLLIAAPVVVRAQAPDTPQPSSRTSRGYTVFLAGAVVGREDVTVESTAEGFIISGQGRLSGSQDVVIRRVEVLQPRLDACRLRARSDGERR